MSAGENDKSERSDERSPERIERDRGGNKKEATRAIHGGEVREGKKDRAEGEKLCRLKCGDDCVDSMHKSPHAHFQASWSFWRHRFSSPVPSLASFSSVASLWHYFPSFTQFMPPDFSPPPHPFSLISISAWHFLLCLLTPILLFPPLGLCQAGLSFGIWPCGTYSHSHPSHRALPLHLFLGAGVCTWSNIYAGEGGSSGYSRIYMKPILCSWKTAVMIVLNGYLYYFVTFLQTIQQNTLSVWLQSTQLKQKITLVIVVLNWE